MSSNWLHEIGRITQILCHLELLVELSQVSLFFIGIVLQLAFTAPGAGFFSKVEGEMLGGGFSIS
jgi:hypothetical protein